MIFSAAGLFISLRRQVMNLPVWRVSSSRPPIRKATCCAAGIFRLETGSRGPAGRVQMFRTWTASRVRHSRSKADISGTGVGVPGIGRPSERTWKQNW